MSFDAIVIGAGQAGPGLAVELAKAGQRVAIAERHLFGGTCVNTGCIPSKALIASAHAAHVARRAGEYGVSVGGPVTVDLAKVKARKDAIVEQSNTGVEQWLRGTDGLTVFTGHARFEAPHVVRIGDERLEAPAIYLNVGARARIPDIPGLDDTSYLTNSSIMDLATLPPHLVIVGGGPVGLEFAQMYRRFGSDVTVIDLAPRVAPQEDPDVSAAIQEALEDEGVQFHLGAGDLRARRAGDGVALTFARDGRDATVEGSHLLLAAGRQPNTDELGADAAGLALDDKGFIEVDDALQTSVEGIYAVGECNGRGAFTHTAYNDYEIVAANVLRGESRRVTDRILTYGLFVDPPLGRVGITETEARESGRPALIGKRPMSKVGRAIEKGETRGFMKVVVDAESRQILGAAVLGVGGDEVVHALLNVMYAGASVETMKRAVHIHPTVSELIPTLLGNLEALR